MHNDCMAKKKSSDVNITAFEILQAVTGQPPTKKPQNVGQTAQGSSYQSRETVLGK